MLTLEGVRESQVDVETRVLPGVECCLAIWAADAPEPEPRQEAAREILRQMSVRDQRTIEQLNRRLPGWSLRAANWFYRLGGDSFDAGLQRALVASPERLAFDLIVCSLVGPDRSSAASAYADDLRGARLRAALRRPHRIVDDILTVIRAFWAAGFDVRWSMQRQVTVKAAERLAPHLQRDLGRGLAAVCPRVVSVQDRSAIQVLGGQMHQRVAGANFSRIDVLPSLWLRRRVVLLYAPDALGICVGLANQSAERLPHDRVTALMAVLGEPRRLEILRLCMRNALSTQQLARMLGLTEAPVCRHLKVLERHKVVVGQRFGRQVTYVALPETVSQLARSLRVIGHGPDGASES